MNLVRSCSQAGATRSKWAIEYEPDAAKAFELNHPGATVFNSNCNVILHKALLKAGIADDCIACPEAVEQSDALPAALTASIPLPGEVQFICGGPPCQGFSGMNRFSGEKGSLWSKARPLTPATHRIIVLPGILPL